MTRLITSAEPEARYHGLRMTAVEYCRLPEDGFRYELIDGVVCMTPAPTPKHQHIAFQTAAQIDSFLRTQHVGFVFIEVDVALGQGPGGRDIVYRPDLVFVSASPGAPVPERIAVIPEMVAEIISSTSRRMDSETKKADYERAGVGEYWLFDPLRSTMTFYRLQNARFVEVQPQGDTFESHAIPGFVLDLRRVRSAMTA